MKLIKKVSKDDIQVALDEVTSKCSAETANLVRAICDSFSLVIEKDQPTEIQPAMAAIGWYAPR